MSLEFHSLQADQDRTLVLREVEGLSYEEIADVLRVSLGTVKSRIVRGRAAPEIEAGRWYRFAAYYRAEGLENEALQVVARLDWVRAEGKRAGQPDYAYRTRAEGEWKKITLEAPAPLYASAVKIQLFLQNAPHATVWWDDISLEPIATPAPRRVTVAWTLFFVAMVVLSLLLFLFAPTLRS